jgi:hypothetical protein
MNTRLLFAGALALFAMTACAPSDRPTVRPLIIKLSESAKVGSTLTIQGRNLGSPGNSFVLFGANELGQGGVRNAADGVVAWSGTEIQVNIPANAKVGGNFIFVSVGSVLSNGMPYSITQ